MALAALMLSSASLAPMNSTHTCLAGPNPSRDGSLEHARGVRRVTR